MFGFGESKELIELREEFAALKANSQARIKTLTEENTKLIESNKESTEKLLKLVAALNADMKAAANRHEREKVELTEKTTNSIIEKFCTVLSLLELAKSSNSKNIEDLQKGIDMIMNNISKTFESFGIEKIDPKSEKFDPNFHEAVYAEASDEVEAGFVIKVFEPGWKKKDKVIKYAKVVVCIE